MKYGMVESERDSFVYELNKIVKKGCKPVWESYKQFRDGQTEVCTVLYEDPEGQTTLTKKKKKK